MVWTACPNCKSRNISLMAFFYRCKKCGNLWEKDWNGKDCSSDFYQGSENPEPFCKRCGVNNEQIIFDDYKNRYYCETCGSILE